MPEFVFPSGFLWGASTSSHQVEGGNTNNDWWAWEQVGRVKEPSGAACDQYHRFESDFELARQLHHNAHRLSIEWSRIEPREGEFDEHALAHYRTVVQALRQRGLEPVVTLHHYTNPLWLAQTGGWANPIVVERFARFARRTTDALGDHVRYWLTINEPMVYMVTHYLDGVGPPGEQNLQMAWRVLEHLVRAHVDAYHAIHDAARAKGRTALVSIAHHVQPFLPCRRWWPPDRWIAALMERFYNFGFLEAVLHGRLSIPARRALRIPEGTRTLDFIGMNYYGRIFMRLADLHPKHWGGSRCSTRHHREVTERNDMDWDVYPPGIRDVLGWGRPYQLPILITENGICTRDDRQRERFILNHLQWVARAIEEGVPVLGYLHWSLLDNFEWAHGFGPRFGLIEVDYATQERRIRDSARRYAEVCRSNRLSIDSRNA